jgi:hypothetical protein
VVSVDAGKSDGFSICICGGGVGVSKILHPDKENKVEKMIVMLVFFIY